MYIINLFKFIQNHTVVRIYTVVAVNDRLSGNCSDICPYIPNEMIIQDNVMHNMKHKIDLLKNRLLSFNESSRLNIFLKCTLLFWTTIYSKVSETMDFNQICF